MHKILSGAIIVTAILFTGSQLQAKSSHTPVEAEKLAEHNERFAALRARLKNQTNPSSERITQSNGYKKGGTKLRIKECQLHCLQMQLKAYEDLEVLERVSSYQVLKRNTALRIDTKKEENEYYLEAQKEYLQKVREKLEKSIAKASQLTKHPLKRQRL